MQTMWLSFFLAKQAKDGTQFFLEILEIQLDQISILKKRNFRYDIYKTTVRTSVKNVGLQIHGENF